MGKNNRHKKFLRQEKAKVKLKAGKKLTKGQNITDTSFKVKKIVLQSQLSSATAGQPQTKKNLTLKELMSRSKHHNVNMRVEALNGMRELAVLHPDMLITNLCNFLEVSAARCTNEDSQAVRQESLKLLTYCLEKVQPSQLEPFISMLILHLSTGMTHLRKDIQEDSLRMLDIILEAAPSLVAQAAPILLPAFLEQISVQRHSGSGERTLSLDLQSRNTSTRWRIKVLGRLHAMLSAVTTCYTTVNAQEKPQEVQWSSSRLPYVPVYMWQLDKPCVIQGIFPTGPSTLSGQGLFKDDDELKKYISMLMPLLFETWSEAGPSQKQKRETGHFIPSEASELLDCVLETIQNLWHYLELKEEGGVSKELTSWFKNSFRKNFFLQIMEYFPYFTASALPEKKERRSKGQEPFEKHPEIICHAQNLAICHLFCCLCHKPNEIQATNICSYAKTYLLSEKHTTKRFVDVLHRMLDKHAVQFEAVGSQVNDVIQAAIAHCLKSPGNLQNSVLFDLLCNLCLAAAKKRKRSLTQSHPFIYAKFVEELPRILATPEATAVGLDTVCQLAALQEPTLLNSVKLYISRIVANLPALAVAGRDQESVQLSVLGVLYQVALWRTDVLRDVSSALLAQENASPIFMKYRKLMYLKKEFDRQSDISQKLSAMKWLDDNAAENDEMTN